MSKIEYFLPRINGWLELNFDDYLSLLFEQEDQKFNKLRSFKGLPMKIIYSSEDSSDNKKKEEELENKNLVSGNFVEILLQQELCLEADNHKGTISIINGNKNSKKAYNIWAQAKIVSSDIKNNLLLLEYNDQIIVVDNFTKIRELNEIKLTKNDLILYYIKKVTNSEYVQFKSQFDKISTQNGKELFNKFDAIKSSLLCLCNKCYIENLSSLKELEERYGTNEESNNNSDVNGSNIDSGKNIIGINGITSRSGRSEESSGGGEQKSERSKKSNAAHEEEDILNEISGYKFKDSFVFKTLFKKDLEKIVSNLFKKNKYYMSKLSNEEFKLIIYNNKENEFSEEKNFFEKNYKALELKSGINVNKNEVKNMASKTKVKFAYPEKKNIYLIGDEKSITSFKTVWEMSVKYSKEIQQKNKEKENIQKELIDLKKKYKIK